MTTHTWPEDSSCFLYKGLKPALDYENKEDKQETRRTSQTFLEQQHEVYAWIL